jgi:uncharacterized membrane protein (UPF0127 family)
MNGSHKLVWAFLPWSAWWGVNAHVVKDQDVIHIGLSSTPTCSNIAKVLSGHLALDFNTQKRGLSGRKVHLNDDETLIFLQTSAQKVSFWMLNTYIPLDLVHFDAGGKMIEVQLMQVEKKPDQPQKIYRSAGFVQLTLEMNPGVHHELWTYPYLCVKF